MDYQQHPVNNENDLSSVIISASPSDLPGTLTLSWGSNIKLWETTNKDTEVTKTTYTSSELPKTYYVEGYNPSNSLKDTQITLSYTAPDNTQYQDTAKITVYKVILSANPEVVCAGGTINSELDICKSEITATTVPAIEGILIDFEIIGNKGYDGIEGKTYYNIPDTSNGQLSSSSGVTNSEGKTSVIYISGTDSSNPETQLYFYSVIKGKSQDAGCGTIEIQINPPEMELEIFLDPENQKELAYLIADGESQAMNKVHIYYQKGENVVNIPGHQISWYFKFWSIETLNEAAYELYREAHGEDVTFFDLNSNEQQTIFNTIQPDYEGTNSETYGSITQTSTTDNDGIATSIYTAGIEEGFIEIIATDEQINISERGSWNFKKIKEKKENTSIKLNHIKIIPSSLKIYCGQSYNFTVKGYDKSGNEIPLDGSKIIWYCENGTINPASGSLFSTFIAPTFPKKDLKVKVTYAFIYTYSDVATIRVYPKIGEFKVDVSRTWDSYPFYFYANLAQKVLKDAYGYQWGSFGDYPVPRYQYYDCWKGNHYQDAPTYTFPTKYDVTGVAERGLNVTEYIDIYFDGEEDNWPAAGYNNAMDGYTWNIINVLLPP